MQLSETVAPSKPSPLGRVARSAGRGFKKPPLLLRDISPNGGDTKTKRYQKIVPPSLKGKGDRGKGFSVSWKRGAKRCEGQLFFGRKCKVRKGRFARMIILFLLLAGCSGGERTEESASALRLRYQETQGCDMEATVSCTQYGAPWEAVLKCSYIPDGESVIEVISPETIAGAKVILDGDARFLQADGKRLNAGTVSAESLSPADALPRLMDALRDGWLLEENAEEWDGVPCTRMTLDQTGKSGGKIFSTLWLKQSDGTPLRGEIAVDGETFFAVEFTNFTFSDIMAESVP